MLQDNSERFSEESCSRSAPYLPCSRISLAESSAPDRPAGSPYRQIRGDIVRQSEH